MMQVRWFKSHGTLLAKLFTTELSVYLMSLLKHFFCRWL